MLELGLNIKNTLDKPNMRSVFKGELSQIGFSVVKVLVIRFMGSFGFSTKLDDSQIDTIVVDTLEYFSYESLEDVILFFKMCRSGRFGTTKRGVDSNLIFGEWMPKYLDDKAKIRENNYIATKTIDSRKTATDEDVKVTYDKIRAKNKIKAVTVYIDNITKKMDRQLLEDTIIDWGKKEETKDYVYLLKQKRKTIK